MAPFARDRFSSTPCARGRSSWRRLLIRALLPLSLLLALPAEAIIIRHDRGDFRYVVDEGDYPQVFSLHRRHGNRVCVATLVAARWALTAAHCLEDTPILDTVGRQEKWPLTIAGRAYAVESLVLHPAWPEARLEDRVDLALLRLDRPVEGIEPVRLYRHGDELDKIVSFLGWGFTGFGTVGRRGNDGRMRRAHNRVSEAGQWLRFRFDDPRRPGHLALPLEGVPGLGDSGGPALLETPQGLAILGVALGELVDPEHLDARQGEYGAIELYERVSSHLEWIESHILAPDAP